MKLRLPICLVATAALLANVASAREFVWEGHGTFSVDEPKGWTITGEAISGNTGFVLTAKPVGPAPALVNLAFGRPPAGAPPTPASLEAALRAMCAAFVANSVEKKFSAHPFTLAQGSGVYAEFTDPTLVGKPSQPNNFKVIRLGLAAPDPHAAAVVGLQFDDPAQPEVAQMMAIVSSLKFAPSSDASAAEPAPSPDEIQVKRDGDGYTLSVPVSALTLRIPLKDLAPAVTRIGGSTENPRYFQLLRKDPNLIISGWFESAERFKDIKTFWAGEVKGLIQGGLPLPADVEFSKVGGWDVITYRSGLSKGLKLTNANLRAERVQAGTWIDLHLSATGTFSAEAGKAELLAALKTFEVIESPHGNGK